MNVIWPDKETEEEGDRDEDRVPLVHLVVDHGDPQVQEDYAVAGDFLERGRDKTSNAGYESREMSTLLS